MGGKYNGLFFEVWTKANYTEVTVEYLFTIVTNNSRQPSTSIANFTWPWIHYGSDNIYITFWDTQWTPTVITEHEPYLLYWYFCHWTAMLIMSSAWLESWITSKAVSFVVSIRYSINCQDNKLEQMHFMARWGTDERILLCIMDFLQMLLGLVY